jgi:hypothetical protein
LMTFESQVTRSTRLEIWARVYWPRWLAMGQKYSLIESASFGGRIDFILSLTCLPAIIGYGALLWVPYLEDYLGRAFTMHSFTWERKTFSRSCWCTYHRFSKLLTSFQLFQGPTGSQCPVFREREIEKDLCCKLALNGDTSTIT